MDDDVDIYKDLPSFHLNECEKCKETSKEFNEKKDKLETECTLWKKKCDAYEEEKKTILTNTSSLMKTARAEIARKDEMISELRRELEDLKFKRGVWSGAKTKRPQPNEPRKRLATKQTAERLPIERVSTFSARNELTGKTFLREEAEDPEQKWEPNKRTVTLYEERLRRRILLEEATERARREKAKSLASVLPTGSANDPKATAGSTTQKDAEPVMTTRADDRNVSPYALEVEEGECLEEKLEAPNNLACDEPIGNKIESIEDSKLPRKVNPLTFTSGISTVSKKFKAAKTSRNENFGYISKSERQMDCLYEDLSKESNEFSSRHVDGTPHDEPSNFRDAIHRGSFSHDRKENFNRSLHLDATNKPRRDDRSRASRESSTHSDHEDKSRGQQRSQHSRRANEPRSKTNYRSRSKTRDRRTNDEKRPESHCAEINRSHAGRYEKRREDRYSSKDRGNKEDNCDHRNRRERRFDDRSVSRNGYDNHRNYDSDHRRRERSRTPGEKSQSRSNVSPFNRRGIKRSRSRNSENNIESNNEHVRKKRLSSDRKIGAHEPDNVSYGRKSESPSENRVEDAIGKESEVLRAETKVAIVHETRNDPMDNNKAATEILNNLLNQIEARDKCILMLEDEEVLLSPLIKPEIQPAGSLSFREEKIGNIEKFIQDFQYDEDRWSVPGNDAVSKEVDGSNVANSTFSLVDMLSMDMEDVVVDKKSEDTVNDDSQRLVDIKTSVIEHKSNDHSECNQLQGVPADNKIDGKISGNNDIDAVEKQESFSVHGKSKLITIHEDSENGAGEKKCKDFYVDNNSMDIAINHKFNSTSTDKKLENLLIETTKGGVHTNKEKEKVDGETKKDEVPSDEKQKEVSGNEKEKFRSVAKQELVANTKKEQFSVKLKTNDLRNDTKKEKVPINKKKKEIVINTNIETVTIDKKKKEVGIHKEKETVEIDKKTEQIEKKRENILTDEKKQQDEVDKKMEKVSIDKKILEMAADKKPNVLMVPEQTTEPFNDKKSGKLVGNVGVLSAEDNLNNSSTNNKTEDAALKKKSSVAINDVNSTEVAIAPMTSSVIIQGDRNAEKTIIESGSKNVAVDQELKDTEATERAEHTSTSHHRSDDIQIHEELDISAIHGKSEKIDKKLENVETGIKSNETAIGREGIGSPDRKSGSFRIEKSINSVIDEKTADAATDDPTKPQSTDETCGIFLTKQATSEPEEKPRKPVTISNTDKTIVQTSPPLPPSPKLPPLPPSPPPEDHEISILPKIQQAKQNTKIQTEKSIPKQTKNRPRIPCLPIVSLYSRKRRDLVLTDSASSRTMVKSAKEIVTNENTGETLNPRETDQSESKLVSSPVKIAETAKRSKTQVENCTNEPIAAETEEKMPLKNSSVTWNISKEKCVVSISLEKSMSDSSESKIKAFANDEKSENNGDHEKKSDEKKLDGKRSDEKTSCEKKSDEKKIDEKITDEEKCNEKKTGGKKSDDKKTSEKKSYETNYNEEKSFEKKSEEKAPDGKESDEAQPEVESKEERQSADTVRTSTIRNLTSSKSSERAKRSALKTIPPVVPSNDSVSSNRKRPLSKEKENLSKPGKVAKVMVITRRRPVQLEDSSTVTTLVSSKHEDANKGNRILRKEGASGEKRCIVDT